METISRTSGPLLCHSLQYVSKNLPIFDVGESSVIYGRLRFHGVNQGFFRTQFNPGKSCRTSLTSLVDVVGLQGDIRPLSCNPREALATARSSPQWQGLFLTLRRGRSLRLESLKFGCSRKERQTCSPATTGDGSSSGASDSSLDQADTAKDATGSMLGFPFGNTLCSRLNQVDWNKLIFNWRKDEPKWTVPWTGQTIFQVMVLWFAAFWIMGSWIIPISAQVAGFSRHTLTFRGQALYSLITDVAEGTVGIWILKQCLARFLPLPDGWFPVKWEGTHWLLEACWGCLLFPFVNKLSQLNLYLIPLPSLTSSYAEQSMMSRDPVATLLYAIVISICAPVWEEIIFRGFLLPSMTRYLPLLGAIFVSALAFALAHFSMQRVLPLTFLGLVMGIVFVRSKNLLASIVLHSLWNGFAFLELL